MSKRHTRGRSPSRLGTESGYEAGLQVTKPSMVSVSYDGKIRHDGKSRGRVYKVAGTVTANDIYEHPRSSVKGFEWITTKEFRLEFLYEYEVSRFPEDALSEDEIRELKKRNAPR